MAADERLLALLGEAEAEAVVAVAVAAAAVVVVAAVVESRSPLAPTPRWAGLPTTRLHRRGVVHAVPEEQSARCPATAKKRCAQVASRRNRNGRDPPALPRPPPVRPE